MTGPHCKTLAWFLVRSSSETVSVLSCLSGVASCAELSPRYRNRTPGSVEFGYRRQLSAAFVPDGWLPVRIVQGFPRAGHPLPQLCDVLGPGLEEICLEGDLGRCQSSHLPLGRSNCTLSSLRGVLWSLDFQKMDL